MSKRSPILIAAFGDLHIGSTVSLCPPTGVLLEDGGRYTPNAVQLWLWARWLDFWKEVEGYRARGYKIVGICNGEFIDGRHHESSQLASQAPEIQAAAALEVMAVAMPKLDTLYCTRGTEAHSGKGAASDYAIARELGAVIDKASGQRAAYQWRIDIGGVIVDAAHHISGSARLTSRGTNIRAELIEMMLEDDAPDILIRSHVHTYADVGRMFGARQALVLPAWQLKTAYGHRVTRRRRQEVGGVLIEVADGRAMQARPMIYPVPIDAPHKAKV